MEQEIITKYSKKLSKILRHRPEMIGLTLDKNGWASVEELMEKFGTPPLSIEILETVVETNDKQRFTFNEDKTKIRANQGHSVTVDLALEATEPPALLFHGTATKNVQSIKEQGLIKGARHHVHLSTDESTAKKVGSRYGIPVILKVRAKEMQEAGYMFYMSDNGVWLTDHVPVRFIVFPS
ncbi:MAG: RNA 2'-phosphotransferase [Saprospiraceae bacterium]|nr:RNA 2'-phosphotransferase [Saprospiraceae bacterium]